MKYDISPAANDYLRTMRGTDEFLRANYGMELVDHDFAPDHEGFFVPDSFDDCTRAIYNLHESLPDDEMNADTLRRNLWSAGVMLGVLSGSLKIGENINFIDYVDETMRSRPAMVPEEGENGLAAQRQEIEELAEQLGFSFHPDDRERFNTAFAIPRDELKSTIEKMLATSRGHLAPIVGSTLIKGLDIVKFEVVESKHTWQGYFGTEGRRNFVAKFNSNPLLKLSPLDILAVQVHEMTHAVSSTNKKMEISRGRLSPGLGLLITTSPSYFQEEVAARSVEEKVLAEESNSSLLAQYVYKMIKYWNEVTNNMIIMANSGYSQEEVAQYGKDRLPFDEPVKLEQKTESYVKNLLFKTVFAVDSEALRAGRRIASLPREKMRDAVVKLCTEAVEPDAALAYN